MRCQRGTRKNIKTGKCEDKLLTIRRERCVNGTRRYPAGSKKCMEIEKIKIEKDRIRYEKQYEQFHKKVTNTVKQIVRSSAGRYARKFKTVNTVMHPLAKKDNFSYKVEYRGDCLLGITLNIDDLKITKTISFPGSKYQKYAADDTRNEYLNSFGKNIDDKLIKLKGKTLKTI